MRLYGLLILAALIHAPTAAACSCLTTGSACDWLRSTPVVFVGIVTEDSGEGEGSGPAKMVVEEVLHGLSREVKEVTVDTAARTSCYMRLKKYERYVIYGQRSSDTRVSRSVCSFSFAVAGNELLLSALREAERGKPQRLIGKVQQKAGAYDVQGEGASGLRVVAAAGDARLETTTNTSGEFEFLNIEPGRYHVTVTSPEVYEDSWRWPKDPAVSTSSCGFQSLFVWPNGTVEGVVRNSEGKPLSDVPVQAFIKDRRGELDTLPIREAKTTEAGVYRLNGLPPGEVVVAVNGERYHDRLPWAPTFYPGTAERDKAKRLVLTRGQALKGVDMTLPAPRTPAILRIEAVPEDGTPVGDTGVRVEDLHGVQRGFALGRDNSGKILTVPVYLGESYLVKTFRHVVSSVADRIVSRSWEGVNGPVTVTQTETNLRAILVEKEK